MLISIGIGILSLLLIYLEFFLPGIILGAFGGVGFCFSIVFFAWKSTDISFTLIFIFSMIIALVLTIKMALWTLKKKPALFAKEEQSGYLASSFKKELIGKEGKVVSDLRPSGYIEVEGERLQALSENLYIKKGEYVKIIAGEGACLIVRRKC